MGVLRRLLEARWAKKRIKSASPRKVTGMIIRGLASPPANQPARTRQAGPHKVWGAAAGEVDVDSASWRMSIGRKGLAREASRGGLGETITQLEHWLICNLEDLYEARWDFARIAARANGRRTHGARFARAGAG